MQVSTRSIVTLTCAAVLAGLSFPMGVYAQQRQHVLQGDVLDERGAVIVGARLVLTGESGLSRETIADSQGRFRFHGLPDGEYLLKTSAGGFGIHEQIVLLTEVAKTSSLPITLYPTIKESIVVNNSAETALGPERAAGTQVLTRQELEAFPDDPDQLNEQLQNLAASSGSAPGQATVTVDGFLAGGRMPPKSAIREVRINPNIYSAEYDTPPFRGGRIEISTKPGVGTLHGSGFFNFNGTALNARDPFAPSRAQTETRRYGFQLGGPVVKKSSGFFLDLERREIDDAATVNAVVLNNAFLPAAFSANVLTPKRLLIGSARFDWQFNQANTLVFRYDANANELENQGAGGFNLAERGFTTGLTEHNFRLTETAIISPRMASELRIGLTWQRLEQRAVSNDPSIVVAGAFASGGATPQRLERDEQRLEIADHAIVNAGKHTMKLGAQLFHKRIGDERAENPQGTFFFGGGPAPSLDAGGSSTIYISGLEQYRRALMALPGGAPTRFTVTLGEPSVSVNQWLIAGFVQDEWQARPSFTVSLGLRYEAQTAPADGNSFAPRLGLAWAPDKKQQWVLRARAGMFYERISESLALEAGRLDGVRQQQIIIDAPSFPDPFAIGKVGVAIPTIRLLADDLRPSASWQTRVELERQLPRGWRISASHSWTRGWASLRLRNINAPLVDMAHPDPLTAPRPFGEAKNLLQFESSGQIAGRVIFVGVNQASNKYFNLFSGYLNFDFHTDADNARALPQSSYDLSGEWARPSWQSRHRVFLTAILNLPLKTRAAFSLNAASGTPFNVTTGRDNNGDGNFNDRPGVADPSSSQAVLTPFGALDPDVTNGTLSRNAGTNPSTATLDLNLTRSFDFGKRGADGESRYRMALNVRASNLLNRTNLTGRNGVLASPFFNRANSAGQARRVEVGLRVNF